MVVNLGDLFQEAENCRVQEEQDAGEAQDRRGARLEIRMTTINFSPHTAAMVQKC